jgi:hypothetical protein
VTDTVKSKCCRTPLPAVLQLTHTADQIAPLKSFLTVNHLVVPGAISSERGNSKLKYPSPGEIRKLQSNSPNQFVKLTGSGDNWRGNVSLSGLDPTGQFQETWDLVFSFGCDSGPWRFSLSVVNTQPSSTLQSRLVVAFTSLEVCPGAGPWNGFTFSVTPGAPASTPASVPPIVVNDDAGFFRNLQMQFHVLAENRKGVGSPFNQFEQNNTRPYDQTLTSGGL